jgi:hypothetical protein
MSILYPSSVRLFLISEPRHHVFPKTSFFKHKQSFCRMMAYCRPQASLLNSLRRFFLPNGILLPNSAHKSVPFLYQFLVLTVGTNSFGCPRKSSSTWRGLKWFGFWRPLEGLECGDLGGLAQRIFEGSSLEDKLASWTCVAQVALLR